MTGVNRNSFSCFHSNFRKLHNED